MMVKPSETRKRRSKEEWAAIVQHCLSAHKKAQDDDVPFHKTKWLKENYQLTRATFQPHLQLYLNEVQQQLSPRPIEFTECKHTVKRLKLSEEEKAKDICPTCNTAMICRSLQDAATTKTKQIMLSMNNMAELDFPDDIKTTTLQQSLAKSNEQVSEQLASDGEFIRFANVGIQYRHLDLAQVVDNLSIPSKIEKNRVKGGFYPSDFIHNPKQVLHSPDDGTIGVATWPTGINDDCLDFIMLETLAPSLTNNDIKEIGINEMKSIADLKMGSRAGAAGGYYIPSPDPIHDNSASLSKACMDQRLFRRISESSTATNVGIQYWNESEGKEVSFHTVYADVYMRRNNRRNKKNSLLDSKVLRSKILSEMKSRLRSFAVTVELGLNKQGELNIWSSFLNASGVPVSELEMTWKKVDASLTLFDMVLLNWSCCTGEMRNHMAIAAHEDGNKSHYMETEMVFPKIPCNDMRTSSSIVRESKPGLLAFPFQGFAIELRCGKDVAHMQLKNTMHLPDNTRDMSNWSWVHGP